MSGRRGASDDETAFFRTQLKDVRPLKQRMRVMATPNRAKFSAPPPRIVAPAFNEEPAGPIGGHDAAHLRRGRSEPEARLDLHGLNQDGAYRALIAFLLRAQSDGKRLVLVITGKGGTLRGALPLWLGQKDLQVLVGGLSEAHVKHGGAGAFYVRIRRLQR